MHALNDGISFGIQIVAVALTAIATRWMVAAKGPMIPEGRGTTLNYRIKWQLRALSFLVVALSLFFIIQDVFRTNAPKNWMGIALFGFLALFGFWFATGLITVDDEEISKKGLGRPVRLRWGEIAEVRVLKRDGGAIELRGGMKKLIVDMRFGAREHLLRLIEDRTHISPTREPGANL